jgi:hypothetical protein
VESLLNDSSSLLDIDAKPAAPASDAMDSASSTSRQTPATKEDMPIVVDSAVDVVATSKENKKKSPGGGGSKSAEKRVGSKEAKLKSPAPAKAAKAASKEDVITSPAAASKTPKSNPLAKFLVKVQPGQAPGPLAAKKKSEEQQQSAAPNKTTEKAKEEEDIQIIEAEPKADTKKDSQDLQV